MPRTTDIDLTDKDITGLASVDALMSFLGRLEYKTDARTALTPESIGLSGESATAIKKIELLSEDKDQSLQVIFVQPRSLTAKVRTDLVRALGKGITDHVLVLSPDFETLEFVLLDKPKKKLQGPSAGIRRQVVPKTITVNRRKPTRLDIRTLRRFTWTCCDALDQFDKLRSVFDAAAYTGDYFQNRGLFADHFLRERLRENSAWRDDPTEMFRMVRDHFHDAQGRWHDQGKEVVREKLFEPLFRKLGFELAIPPGGESDLARLPDYLLKDASGNALTAAFVYSWDRWLDGPDFNDGESPDENPRASVIAALDGGLADWIIVTNGKQWRLYSRHAHARATNFYEVDLVEPLTTLSDTDPNEAFRYWWLFFRPHAYRRPTEQEEAGSWLDTILQGSRDYAKQLGDRLKDRIFVTIFPHLAQGFLADRKGRLKKTSDPSKQELDDIFEATLTLLYRLLFLLYAESRDLLPMREAPYQAVSLKKLKDEIAEEAGGSFDDAPGQLKRAYSDSDTGHHDRLTDLFKAMDKGDPVRNVPTYNGGLFNTSPDDSDRREERIASFLKTNKVPDRYLALAIDRLSRDVDERIGLVPIDFKSLDVRHLGSIYEGLLEFKLILADEDKTTKTEKGQERYISLSDARVRQGRQAEVIVQKGEVYLSNDKADRRASGSYYTPDPIVKYIVAETIGPMLDEKLKALRADFRKAGKFFHNEVQKTTAYPPPGVSPKDKEGIRRFAVEKTYHAHKDLVERLFDIKVLDPAMGSGHFLVEAVDYITDRLIPFLSSFPNNPVGFAMGRTRNSIIKSLGDQGVTVDPAKLIDIHLLKRHVLKRCIYGVDLNPMAVELAKVSLWLDAFTLGAPLSFLDHHLRCGNSLVGTTFSDLENETSESLFKLKYEPMIRAINYVLLVSKVADTTAAEVAHSVTQYDLARRSLSGYQIVLDLLIAEDFGIPQAKEIITLGGDIDLTSRDMFLRSLHGNEEAALVSHVNSLAKQSDRRFFHWEVEFPEIFFDISDNKLSHIHHKNKLAPGTAGFDAIVGNPPYVRVEKLEAVLKKYLKKKYSTVTDRCDLYIAFVQLNLGLLNDRGRLGLITSNQFMNTDYGKPLRDLISKDKSLIRIVDIPPLQLFEDALTYPAILVCAKKAQETISVLSMEHAITTVTSPTSDLQVFVRTCGQGADVSAPLFYSSEIWSTLRWHHEDKFRLEDRCNQLLGSICNISSSMKSGKDDVLVGKLLEDKDQSYVIEVGKDATTIVANSSLWRKVIRPKDLRDDGSITPESRVVFWPYEENNSDSFELVSESSIEEKCPATFEYLSKHKQKLLARKDSGKTWAEHGRAWYSLARIGKVSDYWPPKLLSPGEFIRPRFVISSSDSLFPCARIIGISKSVVDVVALQFYLQSSAAEVWFHSNLSPKGGGYRGMSVGDLARLPVPPQNDLLWAKLTKSKTSEEADLIIQKWIISGDS